MSNALLLVPDALLILLGFVLFRSGAFRRPTWEAIERVVYYLLFPVLLFTAIVRSPISMASTGAMSFAAAGALLVGIALSYAVGRWPGVDSRLHASGAQVAFRFNSYIALALGERLLGPAGVSAMAVLIAVCVPLSNFAAVYPLARQGGQRFWLEILRNPLILGTVCGLAFNLMGARLPELIESAAYKLGQAALPLGLLAVGAGLRLGELRLSPALGSVFLDIKHVVVPAVALGLAIWLDLEPHQAAMAVAFSAMPTATSCYVLAVRMGGAGPFVAGLVSLSTLAGMASIPIWLALVRSGIG